MFIFANLCRIIFCYRHIVIIKSIVNEIFWYFLKTQSSHLRQHLSNPTRDNLRLFKSLRIWFSPSFCFLLIFSWQFVSCLTIYRSAWSDILLSRIKRSWRRGTTNKSGHCEDDFTALSQVILESIVAVNRSWDDILHLKDSQLSKTNFINTINLSLPSECWCPLEFPLRVLPRISQFSQVFQLHLSLFPNQFQKHLLRHDSQDSCAPPPERRKTQRKRSNLSWPEFFTQLSLLKS